MFPMLPHIHWQLSHWLLVFWKPSILLGMFLHDWCRCRSLNRESRGIKGPSLACWFYHLSGSRTFFTEDYPLTVTTLEFSAWLPVNFQSLRQANTTSKESWKEMSEHGCFIAFCFIQCMSVKCRLCRRLFFTLNVSTCLKPKKGF